MSYHRPGALDSSKVALPGEAISPRVVKGEGEESTHQPTQGEDVTLRDDCMQIFYLAGLWPSAGTDKLYLTSSVNLKGQLGDMNIESVWKQSDKTPQPPRTLLSKPDKVFIFDCVR